MITQPQVFQLIDACQTRRLKTFLWATYTLGLRIGEAVQAGCTAALRRRFRTCATLIVASKTRLLGLDRSAKDEANTDRVPIVIEVVENREQLEASLAVERQKLLGQQSSTLTARVKGKTYSACNRPPAKNCKKLLMYAIRPQTTI